MYKKITCWFSFPFYYPKCTNVQRVKDDWAARIQKQTNTHTHTHTHTRTHTGANNTNQLWTAFLFVLPFGSKSPWLYIPDTNVKNYIKKNEKRLIKAASNSTDNIRTNRKIANTRKQKWEEKQLYGYFERQTSAIAHENAWTGLKKGRSLKMNLF